MTDLSVRMFRYYSDAQVVVDEMKGWDLEIVQQYDAWGELKWAIRSEMVDWIGAKYLRVSGEVR